jgi:peptidyl-prolyl cis-trans isomerase D
MNRFSEDRNPQTGIVNNEGKYTVAIGSGFVKNFYDAALYEPPGTKKVIKGESQSYVGYHYIEVLDHQGSSPAYQVAFLSKPIYVSEETNNKAHNAAIQFAAASPDVKSFDANVEKDLKPLGIQKLFAQRIGPNDYYIPGINGMSRSFVKNIYEADKGKVVQPELVGDKYVVAVVTDVLEEGTMPASVARTQVEPVLRNKKKAQKIKEQIGKFTTLEEVAAKFNLTVDKADSLRFLGGSTSLGFEPKVIGASFNPANTGKTVTEPLEGQTAVYLLRVESLGATPVASGTIEEQKASFEARARQTAMGGMSMYGGQQPPPHVAVLRKQAKIKDKRSDFY